jgi:hypothetical protein
MAMHEHLTDVRLMELGMDASAEARNGEAAHLASCAGCAARLAEERRLTAGLMEIAAAARPPAGFAARAAASYRAETREKSRRRFAWIGGSILAAVAVWAVVAWSAADTLVAQAAGQLAVFAAVFRALRALGEIVPVTAGIGWVVILAAVALAGSGALVALGRSSAKE